MPESSVPAEFAGLPAQELAARLAAALEVNARLRALVESKDLLVSQAEARHAWELAERDRRIDELTDRLAQSQRKASRDSSNSSKPPSSDSPFERDKRTERGKDRSLRKKSGRPPGQATR